MSRSKKIMALFLSIVMVLGLLPASAFAANDTSAFSDVKTSAWYHEDVQYVSENGLMKGTGENLFSPDATTTRGMIVTILYRLEGEPSPTGVCPFQDVASGKYYEKAITWAAENGIVSGFSADTFGPDQNITREQMAAILYRYATYKKYDVSTAGDLSKFPDADKVSSYAVDAMKWANAAGLINGSNDGKLYPAGNATRAQVAAILTRFCKNIAAQCTVTFQLNYGSEGTYTTLKVAKGDTITAPKAPTRSGYTFSSWSEKTSGSAFDFKTPIEKDITLYAQWNKKSSSGSSRQKYTVTFDANCNNAVESPDSQIVQSGGYAVTPSISNREGYQFAGWFINKDETDWKNTFSFRDTQITKDITLYAKWVDITTDSDGDGLSDELEKYCGTNINVVDTDGDGLTDYQEVVIVGTDPLLFDTDGNGTSDYDEDNDSDKISNGREIDIGTDPNNQDSDNDGLTDYEEIITYSTDATNSDTDEDGALDGWEIENGFNPCIHNDSFEVSVVAQTPTETNPVTAGVDADLDGEAASSLAVEPIGASSNPLLSTTIPGYLGSAYNFEIDNESTLHQANLNFSFDKSIGTIGPDFQPRIYYFNENDGTFEELENQVVTAGSVSAPVSHFSTYILLNKVEFEKVWNIDIKPPIFDDASQDATLNVAFVVDYSLSMDENDHRQLFKQLSKEFISNLRDGQDQASVIKFIRSATLVSELTTDKSVLNRAIDSISYDNGHNSNSGTDGSTGLRLAIDELNGSDSKYRYIIFITDGEDNQYTYSYDSLIAEAAEDNIIVYTIGMGSASESILKKVANGTNGKYYHATTSDVHADDILDLGDVFEEIASETVDLTTDSNKDGIPDYFNDLIRDGKLTLSNRAAEFYGIDFNYDANGNPSDDWDGDGLKNGEELIITYNKDTGAVYMRMNSDPTMIHSDGDGISDYDEVKNGTNPLIAQYKEVCVDGLTNNNKYHYEKYVSRYDDDFFYRLNSAFLAVVFGAQDIHELGYKLLADYFLEYVDIVDEETEKESRALMIDILDDLLGKTSKIKEKFDDINVYIGIVSKIKGLMDATNSHTMTIKAISIEYTKIAQELLVYYPDVGEIVVSTHSMSETSVSVLTKTSSLDTTRIDNVLITLDLLSDAIDGVIDMADTITTLAAVNANAKVFDENIDYLVELRDNGFRPYIMSSASTVINAMGEGYGSAVAEALAQDKGELTINILITVASKNPYIESLTFARDILSYVTKVDKDTEYEYQMLSYNCMSNAIKNLISKNSYCNNGYYYDCSGNLERYLTHLAQIRILGEKTYGSFYLTGANKWFNDEDETREKVTLSVETIQHYANALGLHLSSKLS